MMRFKPQNIKLAKSKNEVKPKQTIEEVFQPGSTELDQFIMDTVKEGKEKIKKGMEEVPNYNIYR